jgi:hypothetical protein
LNARQANLDGIKLKRAILKGAVLEKALLQKANLEQAILQGATLQEAILWQAKLRKAELVQAKLVRAILYDADLSGAKLEKANLRKADLRKAVLEGADLREADLEGANLEGANLEGADLREARNLTPEQVQVAKNWDKALHDPKFRKQLNFLVERQEGTSSNTTYYLDAKNAHGITIFISKGDVITASGSVHTNPNGKLPKCDVPTGPEGIKDCDYIDKYSELKSDPFMALIGEFNGEPSFTIGEKYDHRNKPPGILVLKVNDLVYEDNAGSLKITVTKNTNSLKSEQH